MMATSDRRSASHKNAGLTGTFHTAAGSTVEVTNRTYLLRTLAVIVVVVAFAGLVGWLVATAL